MKKPLLTPYSTAFSGAFRSMPSRGIWVVLAVVVCLIGGVENASAQCTATLPSIDGDASVCADEMATYTVVDFDGTSVLWTLQSGGTIVGANNGVSVDIQWDNTPGGPHQLFLTEIHAGNCVDEVSLEVEIEGIISIGCNDGVQVSLDESCQAVITADIIVEGSDLPDDSFEVIVMDSDGNVVPNATVTDDHIGDTLSVQINHLCSGGSCWGTITVEDKLPPILDCGPDVTIDCTDNTDPAFTGFPSVTENCSNVDFQYFDEMINLGCVGPFSQEIIRTWIGTDSEGNSDTCVQTILLVRATLGSITFPPNYDDLDQPAFQCGQPFPTLPSGNPSPDFTGYPSGIECFNIQYYFVDLNFEICGAGLKVLRHWTVIDWCTGMEIIHDQVIKIVDEEAPVISCPPDTIRIGTDPGECLGTIDVLPDPIVIFECSNTTYTVAYKIRDENGDPFEDPITDNVIDNGDGTFGIFDLPVDTSWIIYTVTDDCGYSEQCFTEIIVVDDEPPTAVCEGHTVITLADNGWADAYAETFDDHSRDNCGVDRFEVRRLSTNCGNLDDLVFGDRVNFCCEDIENNPIQVVMRVYDLEGLYNDCVVNVTVQDKLPPIITHCPADITVNCDFDYSDPANTGGYPWADDNCDVDITFTDSPQFNSCGFGRVRRVWRVTDPGGLQDVCVQNIYVQDIVPFGPNDIIWPADRDINGCSVSDASIDVTGQPIIHNDDCIDVAISYDDEVFYSIPDACLKILRTWTVIDWCNYDVTNPNSGSIWQYTQKITLRGTIGPSFSGCQDVTVTSVNPDCSAYVELIVTVDDDCTPSNDIDVRYEVDLHRNGSIDAYGIGTNASGTYPAGNHQVTFYATDGCGNTTTCEIRFMVHDDKAPSPVCLNGVSFPLPEHGSITIWANDFEASSSDNCTHVSNLTYSFSSNTNEQGKTFTCDDLPDGVAAEIELEVWVTDEAGNQAFCTTTVLLTDNKNICPDAAGVSASVSGRVFHESQIGVEDVMVHLENMSGTDEEMEQTSADGGYAFEQLELYHDYEVSPEKLDESLNGVSTLDLVLIQKHILGLTIFDSPYKYIAADINDSYSVSAADLVELRKLVLGVYETFPRNTSWRFVDATYEFPDATQPWGFPEAIAIEDLLINDGTADFVAVKIGDVSGNATLSSGYDHGGQASNRGSQTLGLTLAERADGVEDGTTIEFYADDFDDVLGFQFTIAFETSELDFLSIADGALHLGAEHFGLHRLAEGLISVSWSNHSPVDIPSTEALFALTFKPKATGELAAPAIGINSAITTQEAYRSDLSIVRVELEETNTQITTDEAFALYQNQPNPFSKETTIGFQLPKASSVTLKVFDVQGRLLHVREGWFEAGYGHFEITKAHVSSSGILYYQIETDTYTASKKMIILE